MILSEMLKMVQLALAALGFVVGLGLVAFAFEPHYKERRERVARWWKNRRAWGLIGKDDDYGFLPGRERNRVRR